MSDLQKNAETYVEGYRVSQLSIQTVPILLSEPDS